MKKLVLLAVALLTSSAALAQQGGCVSVLVGSQEKNRGAFESTFSATRVLDVDLSVVFTPGAAQRFGRDHLIEFRVFTPTGRLYQSLVVPFSSDPARKGKQIRVPGYPDPVAIGGVREIQLSSKKHYAVSMRLPVAGTNIVTNSLYGKWSAQVFVDGERVPCSSAAQFTITQ